MDSNPTTTQTLALGQALFHELPVPIPNDPRLCRYLVIETGLATFPAACALLRHVEGEDETLVPLLLLQFPLDGELQKLIPKTVPWLLTAEFSELELLQAMLAAPVAAQTLPCVDFFDYAAVLRMGGEIRLDHDSGDTPQRLAWRLRKIARRLRPGSVACLHLRSPRGQSPLPALGQIAAELEQEGHIGKDALFIPSALEGKDDLFHAIMLTRS